MSPSSLSLSSSLASCFVSSLPGGVCLFLAGGTELEAGFTKSTNQRAGCTGRANQTEAHGTGVMAPLRQRHGRRPRVRAFGYKV